jgi:hypothetical protein
MLDAQTPSDRVEIDGDEAQARAYFVNPMVLDREDGTNHLDVRGVYVHLPVRTREGWRSRQLVEELRWERRSD